MRRYRPGKGMDCIPLRRKGLLWAEPGEPTHMRYIRGRVVLCWGSPSGDDTGDTEDRKLPVVR